MLNIKITKLPKSEIEIEAELEAAVFENYFSEAIKRLGENMELDGFRKGKVPENVLLKNIPEIQILEEMANLAINEHYPKIITGEISGDKIDAIGRPEVSITKLARKNPLCIKIKTAVVPEIKLPDYKQIAKDILSNITDTEKNVEVSPLDVENTIMDIRKSRAAKKHVADRSAGDKHTENQEPELPEFNDEFVKALGPFENVEDFKDKLKINLKLEKENQLKEKTRLKMIEKIIDDSTIEMPEVLISMELDKILYRMESDITTMGLKFDEYLKHINKTVEDLRKEFRNDGEKKAKLALILHEIAKIEKIVADEEEIIKEVDELLKHYKEADPERAKMHAENVLINEKIFRFLESQ